MSVQANAARFMTVPFTETLQEGKWSIWQFALYEKQSTKKWRRMNRLDIGLYKGLEAGVFVIIPKDGQSDTWLNLQYQPINEKDSLPAVSVGIWDIARKKAYLFSDKRSGPSPFISVSKTLFKWDSGYMKTGVSYGFNRLHGLFGGIDARWKNIGAMMEYAPENLRLPNADSIDASVYLWFMKNWRARVSNIGGNPMFDVFFMYTIGKTEAKN